MSHDILNGQEELLVLKARRRLVDEINSNGFFAIICDESSDISKVEQLSLSEDFIGIMPCDEGLTSEAVLKYVKDIIVRCNMDPTKLISMAFDGTSAMKHFV